MKICRKISLNIFFSSRNIEPFWAYKNFSSLEGEHVHSPPIYGRSIKWRNSKEKQFKKWVEIFQVGIFWVEIFRGGGYFPGGSLMGENFPGRNFPRGNFPRTIWYTMINNFRLSLRLLKKIIRRKVMLQKNLRNIYRLFSLKIMCWKSNLKTKSY